MTVNCTITGGFSYTTPSVSLHAAPYGAISIGIDPPDNVAPGNGSCTESAAGGPVAVSTTPGTRWPLTFLVPDASVPSPHDGPFTSTLTIPPNSVTATMGFYPCTLVLPTSALPMSATYDGSTGTTTKTGAATAFGVDNSSCVSAGAVGAMHSASVTLSEVGSPAKHPNIVYVP
ncbi:hypothetical protein [Nocardioides sp. L-11A]|uniref:hypothetical protein n=1 Tax=Nocardioides sp. L-11A TaxID=3043848 RepID=UPI00249A20B4|nr:hypothetical protein QJ852_17010 [Nocardioides sp. L-11A]